jgi:dTDP-4-dehydrorhamnose reductase
VVADQVGTPTAASSLAGALWAAASQQALGGIYHWSDAGVCSWYDFAQAIGEEAESLGLVQRAASGQADSSGLSDAGNPAGLQRARQDRQLARL